MHKCISLNFDLCLVEHGAPAAFGVEAGDDKGCAVAHKAGADDVDALRRVRVLREGAARTVAARVRQRGFKIAPAARFVDKIDGEVEQPVYVAGALVRDAEKLRLRRFRLGAHRLFRKGEGDGPQLALHLDGVLHAGLEPLDDALVAAGHERLFAPREVVFRHQRHLHVRLRHLDGVVDGGIGVADIGYLRLGHVGGQHHGDGDDRRAVSSPTAVPLKSFSTSATVTPISRASIAAVMPYLSKKACNSSVFTFICHAPVF